MPHREAGHLGATGNQSQASYFRALSCQYAYDFLSRTPRESVVAYRLCTGAEYSGFDDPQFANIFPPGRADLEQEREEFRRTTKGLKEKLRAARKRESETKDMIVLITQIDPESSQQASPSSERQNYLQELQAELAKIESEIGGLESQLEGKRLSEPRHRYIFIKPNPDKKELKKVTEPRWEALLTWFKDGVSELDSGEPPHALRNLQVIQDALGLSDVESKILTFMMVRQNHSLLREFISAITDNGDNDFNRTCDILARFLEEDFEEIASALRHDGNMAQLGIISLNETGGMPRMGGFVSKIVSLGKLEPDDFLDHLIGPRISTHLDLTKHFKHLGAELREIRNLALGFLERRPDEPNKGVSIYVEGPPGTGKTSMVAALGNSLGLEVRLLGENVGRKSSHQGHDNGNKNSAALTNESTSLTPNERLLQIILGLAVAKKHADSLMVVIEEIDDTIGTHVLGNTQSGASRIMFQRILEDLGVIAVFTSNHLETHDAIKQRLSYYMQFYPLNAQQRLSVLETLCERHELLLNDEEKQEIATRYQVPVRILEGAIINAQSVMRADHQENPAALVRAFIENQSYRDHGDSKATTVSMRYYPDFPYALLNPSRPDIKPQLFLQQAAEYSEQAHLKLHIGGYTGSMKRQYVWQLANYMKHEVYEVSLEDIAPMGNVDQQALGEVLEEAKRTEILLLFSLSDELLSHQGYWGLLRQILDQAMPILDAHPDVPFVLLTGDKLALYPLPLDHQKNWEFTLTLTFDFLTPEQNAMAFHYYFGQAPEEASVSNGLKQLRNLTPKDFERVREEAALLGRYDDANYLLEQLRHISKSKLDMRSLRNTESPLGFREHGR